MNSDEGRINLEPDAAFDAWCSRLPATHWAKYDLSACRLGWDAARAAPAPQPVEPARAELAGPKYTPEQMARLAFVVFYSGNLCAPQNIDGVLKEIGCDPMCEHVSGSTCRQFERGEFCPFSLAEDLRNLSVALYGPDEPTGYRAAVWGPGAPHGPALSTPPKPETAAVSESVYLSAVKGRADFREAYRNVLPIVRAAEGLRDKWRTRGQQVDSDDFFAAIHAVSEAVDAAATARASQKGGE